MAKNVLITGGAGFIGSHLADELLRAGHDVRVLDSLAEQVHGGRREPPAYLSPEVDFRHGDVRDAAAVEEALQGIDVVYHFAAAVGVGQSMYEMRHYVDHNCVGTSVLLEALIRRPVERLIVASSMSLYGEGRYRDSAGEIVDDAARDPGDLRRGVWEPTDDDGEPLEPLATPEEKPPAIASVYALSKYDQERLCLMAGGAYDFGAVALRFFNVYGPRQALSNPYTGVLAIFGSRYLNERPPLVFEDGMQRRDFVSVYDIARACRLAMERDAAVGHAINVGSGVSRNVLDVADSMRRALGCDRLQPRITAEYRVGDIRHCFADISRARELLGYEPQVEFDEGVEELAEWMRRQTAADRVDEMHAELARRGLTVGG